MTTFQRKKLIEQFILLHSVEFLYPIHLIFTICLNRLFVCFFCLHRELNTFERGVLEIWYVRRWRYGSEFGKGDGLKMEVREVSY